MKTDRFGEMGREKAGRAAEDGTRLDAFRIWFDYDEEFFANGWID